MLVALLASAAPAWAGPAFLDQGFILAAPATGPFAGGVGAPTVDYDARTGTYAMYFESPTPTLPAECDTAYAIGRATSSDGVNWVVDAEPVLGPDLGTPGSPFHCVAAQPAIVFDGATWHLFFTMASEPVAEGQPNTSTGIGYATSADGTHFTVQSAPLIAYDGVTLGLPSAVIVDRVLYLMYVWRPDFRIASIPLDGGTNWTIEERIVLYHSDAGDWALQWVLGPSVYCEEDQTDPFSLVFGGDDDNNARNLGYARSATGYTWSLDAENPLPVDTLDTSSLNHWDVLEAGADALMWYSKTDPETGLKAIGHAVTAVAHDVAGPRMCPRPAPPDTGTTDTGTTDTAPTDTAGTDSTAETGSEPKDGGACGCASPGGAEAAGLLVALAGLLIRRRRTG